MSARVDKQWVEKGLDTYATEAILGTLAHYGVTVDEAGYRALAEAHFPLAIAHHWHEAGWKGTGQFSRFPAAAAEELWRRLCKGQIAPTDVALAIINLLTALNDALEQKPDDGTWDTRFKVVENYLPSMPPPGERRDAFVDELVAALGDDWMEVFDAMGHALAKKGQLPFAQRFAHIEEGLFPVREGVAVALVKAAAGEEAAALADLRAIAADGAKHGLTRLSAVDALLTFDRFEEGVELLLALLDTAEAARDLELGASVIDLLSAVAEDHEDLAAARQVRPRIARFIRAVRPEGASAD